jgi:hypothetical protein
VEFGSPPPSARFRLAANRGVVDERGIGFVDAPVVCVEVSVSPCATTGGSSGEYASCLDAYEHLQFLSPPRFPPIDHTRTTAFVREVTP